MVQIPEPAKERLLHLMRILEQAGEGPLTSGEIESRTGWASHTIRKDISYLEGDFGSSSGYNIPSLTRAITESLGLNRSRKFCVVGLGRLGSAYLNFSAYQLGEFELVAGFDSSVNRVEILKSPVPLYPAYKMPEVIGRFGIELALLCVPEASAQQAAEKLAAAGIKGIVNFAPVVLDISQDIVVRNVYVADELRSLAVKITPEGNEA
ncbi:redox-sensing transcriptional repressor Rex [Breznakiella homolactica]|uniref:Redox-sensing transcriptional repressor Rex n=1 Tax=Breznakiella homolactica TaxID=2798577 RepID=A0A7T7XQ85_9SPIR|nr:redox-sensing transcriptional repressor Rex [Breznakiella homolactica]QQO10516.1 redox-sensing transcriptional repressor Rex [Breznakiella homolactica]